MSYGSDQALFMDLGGQTTDEFNLTQAKRYLNHLAEEARETQEAWEKGDLVKSIDGATDTIVVALGFIVSCGIDPDLIWGAVMRANLSKVDGSLGPIVWREDGQIGKPAGFVPPEEEIRQIIRPLLADD